MARDLIRIQAAALSWALVVGAQAGAETLAVGAGSGARDEVVPIPIAYTGSATVALQLDIVFDASKLSAGLPVAGDAASSHILDSSVPVPGRLRLVVYSGVNRLLGASGTLATVPFTVSSTAPPGPTPLSLVQVVMADGRAIAVPPDGLTSGSIEVLPGAGVPRANAGPDQTVREGTTVTLDGSASIGNNLTYAWTQTAGDPVALSSATAPKPTFVAPTLTNLQSMAAWQGGGDDGGPESFVSVLDVDHDGRLDRVMWNRGGLTIEVRCGGEPGGPVLVLTHPLRRPLLALFPIFIGGPALAQVFEDGGVEVVRLGPCALAEDQDPLLVADFPVTPVAAAIEPGAAPSLWIADAAGQLFALPLTLNHQGPQARAVLDIPVRAFAVGRAGGAGDVSLAAIDATGTVRTWLSRPDASLEPAVSPPFSGARDVRFCSPPHGGVPLLLTIDSLGQAWLASGADAGAEYEPVHLGPAARLVGADFDGDGGPDLPYLSVPRGATSGGPDSANPMTLSFQLTVSDGNRTSVPDTVSVTVVPCSDCLEADVAPRPDGNQALSVGDWLLSGRFALGLDVPAVGNELQRADCAPTDTKGDGTVTVADWVQAGRYAAALDPPVPAGGPSGSFQFLPDSLATAAESTGATLIAQATLPGGGDEAEVAIELSNETAVTAAGFSLGFDPALLTFVRAEIGGEADGATLIVNRNLLGQGRIGFGVAMPPGRAFPRRASALVRVRFQVTSAEGVTTQVRFTDLPVRREVVDLTAAEVLASYVNATVSRPSAGDPAGGGARYRGASGRRD